MNLVTATKARFWFWYSMVILGTIFFWSSGVTGALLLFACLILGSVAVIVIEGVHPHILPWNWAVTAWFAIGSGTYISTRFLGDELVGNRLRPFAEPAHILPACIAHLILAYAYYNITGLRRANKRKPSLTLLFWITWSWFLFAPVIDLDFFLVHFPWILMITDLALVGTGQILKWMTKKSETLTQSAQPASPS